MKKLGLFLLKYNIHLMTLVFIGCAIRAACRWSEWLLVQKLVMGMFAFMIVHEYEETMSKPNLLDLITRVTGLDRNISTQYFERRLAEHLPLNSGAVCCSAYYNCA